MSSGDDVGRKGPAEEGGSLVDRHEVEKLLLITGALEAGLVDALDRDSGLTAAGAAREVNGDERACRIVLEALVSLGVAERRDADEGEPAYTLSAYGRTHLVTPGPSLERSSLLHQRSKVQGWLDIPEVLRNGKPQRRGGGSRDLRSFVFTMAEGAPEVMDEVVRRVMAYARPLTEKSMVDVGGAVGHMALRFADQGLQSTLVDRADVVSVAGEYLGERAGVIEYAVADFTEELPPGPFGLAYLGSVCHIYGPDTNRRLLRRVHSVLAPGGTVAVRDFVWERSSRAPMFAVNMLQATQEGGVWTEAEYRAWLEEAGFGEIEVQDLEHSGNQLVLGRRPG